MSIKAPTSMKAAFMHEALHWFRNLRQLSGQSQSFFHSSEKGSNFQSTEKPLKRFGHMIPVVFFFPVETPVWCFSWDKPMVLAKVPLLTTQAIKNWFSFSTPSLNGSFVIVISETSWEQEDLTAISSLSCHICYFQRGKYCCAIFHFWFSTHFLKAQPWF